MGTGINICWPELARLMLVLTLYDCPERSGWELDHAELGTYAQDEEGWHGICTVVGISFFESLHQPHCYLPTPQQRDGLLSLPIVRTVTHALSPLLSRASGKKSPLSHLQPFEVQPGLLCARLHSPIA